MSKTLIRLLAGAALTLGAAPALAAAPDAQQQAKDDASAAAKPGTQVERREVRIYRGERAPGGGPMVMRGHDRAEHLKALLQLRPEQDAALTAFLDATKAQPGGWDPMARFHGDADSRTAPERLAEMEARLDAQQAAMRRRIEATKAFYAQLDAPQKKAFDALPLFMMAGPGIGPMLIPIHGAGPSWRHGDRFERPPAPDAPAPPRAPRS